MTVVGSTRSGWGRDSGAPLLRLRFDPVGSRGATSREVLAVARSMDSVDDEALLDLLARATPGRPAP